MENVSKALLIAGTFLIAILLLSLLVATFNKIRTTPNEQNLQYDQNEITQYNRGFEVYQKSLMYGTDAISVVNKGLDHNLRNAIPGANYFTKAFSDPVNGQLMDVKLILDKEHLDFNNRITIYHYNKAIKRELSYTNGQGPFTDGRTLKEVLIFEGGRYSQILSKEILNMPFVSSTEKYDFKGDSFIYKEPNGNMVIATGRLKDNKVADPDVNRDLMVFLSHNKITIENPIKTDANLWTRIVIEPAAEDLKKKIFSCETDKTEYYKTRKNKNINT